MRLRNLDSSHERRVRARARGAAQALTQQRDKALESKAAAEAKLRAARETLALAADDEARHGAARAEEGNGRLECLRARAFTRLGSLPARNVDCASSGAARSRHERFRSEP
eukprot:4324815-Pleurochrysis_carterae.AAC.1